MRNWKWLVTAVLPLLWMLPAAGVPVWSGAAEEPVPPPKAAPGKPGNGAGGFYGVEVRAEKRVVFLVDVSGSMGAVTPEGGSRLDVMKRELRRAVGSAVASANRIGAPKEAGNFRVWAFSSGLQLFPDLEPCGFRDRSAVERLNRFVGALGAGGSTNMLMAWRKILELTKHGQLDTVYFLSDGDPSDCSAEELKRLLTRLPKDVTVHCFAIGLDSSLLREIAAAHNGNYVVRM